MCYGEASLFVSGILIGMEKVNQERFSAPVEQGTDRRTHPFLVERHNDLAKGIHPLSNFQSHIAWNDCLERADHSISCRSRPPTELECVAESGGSNKPAFRP